MFLLSRIFLEAITRRGWKREKAVKIGRKKTRLEGLVAGKVIRGQSEDGEPKSR